MLPDKSRIDLFDQYLRGELSPEEKTNFEQSLLSDPSLNHDYNQYLQLVNSITIMSREWLKQKVKKKGKVKYWGNAWGKKWTIAYAAIFLLFILIYLLVEQVAPLNKNNSSDHIALHEGTDYTENNPLPPNHSSSTDSSTMTTRLRPTLHDEKDVEVLDDEPIDYDDDILEEVPPPESIWKRSLNQGDKLDASEPPPTSTRTSTDLPMVDKEQKLKPSWDDTPLDVKKSELVKDTILPHIRVWKDQEKAFKEDTHKIHIAFFTSPLNSKTYTFAHSKSNSSHLMVWGLPQDHNYIKCWMIGKDLYLQLKQENEAVFKFTPNQYYLPLQIETNKDILSLLHR